MEHSDALDHRQSIIYEKRPALLHLRVGDYTFLTLEGCHIRLYKTCRFEVVGEHHGKPIVSGRHVYFIRAHP